MGYDINEALERLEKNLQNVDSARKQVEETVAASEKLQGTISKYSESLNSLNKEAAKFIAEVHNYQSLKTSELESAINNIKIACENVITKFNTDVKSSTELFNSKFTETLAVLSSENKVLTEQVQKLTSLHEALNAASTEIKDIEKKLDDVAKELKESQSEQDNTLNHIKASVDNIPSTLKNQTKEVVEKIDNIATNLNTKVDEIKSNTDSIITELSAISTGLKDTKKLCDNIITDIAQLKSTTNTEFALIKKNMTINRWILIIGFVLMIILHFIKF